MANGQALTHLAVFPDVCLHTDSVVCVLLEKSQPDLHGLGVSVANLQESPSRDTFKVLLALLENEMRLWHCPALGDLGQRYGAEGREAQVVSGPEGKVAEELQVRDAVGSELQVAGRHAVGRRPSQGLKVESLDCTRKTESVLVTFSVLGVQLRPTRCEYLRRLAV